MPIKIGQALWAGTKAAWIGVAVLILLMALYPFKGDPNGESWIVLILLMHYLTFPAGVLVSLGRMVLQTYFSIRIETTYLSLAIEWSMYFALGYIQWFMAYYPAFPIWLASCEPMATKGDFPRNFCLRSTWNAACRPQRATKPADLTIFGASPAVFGHSFPGASIGVADLGTVPVMRNQPRRAAHAGH